jgi:hypothetical protein
MSQKGVIIETQGIAVAQWGFYDPHMQVGSVRHMIKVTDIM